MHAAMEHGRLSLLWLLSLPQLEACLLLPPLYHLRVIRSGPSGLMGIRKILDDQIG